MTIRAKLIANADECLLVWKAVPVTDCVGFEVRRERLERDGVEQSITANLLGYKGQSLTSVFDMLVNGKQPVNQYEWSDQTVSHGDMVRYCVVPVMLQPDGTMKTAAVLESYWTGWARVERQETLTEGAVIPAPDFANLPPMPKRINMRRSSRRLSAQQHQIAFDHSTTPTSDAVEHSLSDARISTPKVTERLHKSGYSKSDYLPFFQSASAARLKHEGRQSGPSFGRKRVERTLGSDHTPTPPGSSHSHQRTAANEATRKASLESRTAYYIEKFRTPETQGLFDPRAWYW